MESIHKIGQEFKCTLVVVSNDSPDCINLKIKELDNYLEDYESDERLLEAFDPETRRKKLLAEKERIENELKQLEESE